MKEDRESITSGLGVRASRAAALERLRNKNPRSAVAAKLLV
jgi:hypothetical protein